MSNVINRTSQQTPPHAPAFSAPTNTATLDTGRLDTGTLKIDADRPTPFIRLVQAELRKMRDTRSATGLVTAIAVMTVAIPIIQLILFRNDPSNVVSFASLVGVAKAGSGLLLPIMALLLITSEWSQRTALTTFALTPHRGRVVAAKLATVVLAALAACALVLVVSAAANLASGALGNTHLVWDFGAMDFVVLVVSRIVMVLTGFALGAMFLSSPGAIVAYFVATMILPTAITAMAMLSWFTSVANWINPAITLLMLNEEPSVTSNWAHYLVATLVWTGVPLAIGAYRIVRTEIK